MICMGELKVGWIVLGEEQEDPYISPWGLMKSDDDLQEEYEWIEREHIQKLEEYGFELFGGDIVREEQEVYELEDKYKDVDVLLVYGVSGSGRDIPKALTTYKVPTIWFTKVSEDKMYGHGLYQQWYLKDFTQGMDKIDLVVNDFDALLSKLRSRRALKTIQNTKLLCIGPANDFFAGERSMANAIDKFSISPKRVSFQDFKKELEDIPLDDERVRGTKEEFLENSSKVSDEITQEKALKSARMYVVIKKLMERHRCNAVTVNCLSGILNLIQVTPCLTFKKLRDEGTPAVCEADIPQTVTSIILREVAEKPTFINDPVILPQEDKIILAHCTCATRMSGFDEEPEDYQAKLHHETKLGLAPSVKLEEGQEVSVVGFSHDLENLLAVKGKITRNTDYHICITQVEVEVPDAQYLMENFVGFHWVLVYGDYIQDLENFASFKDLNFLFPE